MGSRQTQASLAGSCRAPGGSPLAEQQVSPGALLFLRSILGLLGFRNLIEKGQG